MMVSWLKLMRCPKTCHWWDAWPLATMPCLPEYQFKHICLRMMFLDQNMFARSCTPKLDLFHWCFFSVSFLVINSENESNFTWKCEDNENHELISVAIGFHHCDSHQKIVSRHGEMIGPTKTSSLNICDKRNKL
jgi:hypothetical protein